MGVKATYFCVAGSMLTSCLVLISSQCPQYEAMYMLATFRIEVYLRQVHVHVGPIVCLGAKAFSEFGDWKPKKGESVCDKLKGTHSLWYYRELACNYQAVGASSACTAFQHAYWGMTAQLIIIIFNLIMQGVASSFVWYYFSQSQKQKYRMTAWVLYILAPILLVIGLLLEFILLMQLNDLGGSIAKSNSSINVTWGYFLMVFTWILQCIIPCIFHSGVKTKGERIIREQKAKEKYELEMAETQAMAHDLDPYGLGYPGGPQVAHGYGGGYPDAGYGGQPGYGGGYPDPGYGGQPGYDPYASQGGYPQHPQQGGYGHGTPGFHG